MSFTPRRLKTRPDNQENSPLPTNKNWHAAAGQLNYSSSPINPTMGLFTPKVAFSSKENIAPMTSRFPHVVNGFGAGGVSPSLSYRRSRVQQPGYSPSSFMEPTPINQIQYMSPSPQSFQRPTFSPPSRNGRTAVHLSHLGLDDSVDCGSSQHSGNNRSWLSKTSLPAWTMDSEGQIKVTFADVLAHGIIKNFAKDKIGCRFLQDNYPVEGSQEREKLAIEVLHVADIFENLCKDVFGNFFIQCVIENANVEEMRWISSHLTNNIFEMCLNRYSCRVVQKALECLSLKCKGVLLLELHGSNLVQLCIDQNANHVIQKIMNAFPFSHWSFIVERFVTNMSDLFKVAENKYGCRVIQLAIELLSAAKAKNQNAEKLLVGIMCHVISNCERLASNEFANYIIQHVIKEPPMALYRDSIIEKCILRNILSMSQEKYASHVVEKALEFAPPALLRDMMEEIFDGYVPHPETKKDAVDIMLFHQYGNYVVQRMIKLCVSAVQNKRQGKFMEQCDLLEGWLHRLETKIQPNEKRLGKYSSGKKILCTLGRSVPQDRSVGRFNMRPSAPFVPTKFG